MKNKKLLVGLLSASGIAITLPAIASCSSNPITPVDPIDPVQKQVFDIEGDTLKGFNSSASEQTIKDYCKDGVLRLPAVKTIAANAFNAEMLRDAPWGTSIEIDASTTSIGEKAFFGNSATSITWNGGVSTSNLKTIGESAFAFCYELTSFEMPAGLFASGGSIATSAFAACNKLATIDATAYTSTSAPAATWNFGCFSGIAATGTIKFSSTFTTDENKKLVGKNIWTKFVLNGVKPAWNMADSTGSTSTWGTQYKFVPEDYFTVTSNVLTGAKRAWQADDTAFTYAAIPSGVTSIDFSGTGADNIFTTRKNIVEWDLTPATGLTAIPESCFATVDTPASKKIMLGSGVTTIGASAFAGFTGTISLTSSNITSIGASAFNNSSISSWKFAATVAVGSNAFNTCSSLTTLDFSEYSAKPTATWGTNVFSTSTGGTGTNTLTLKNVEGTTPTTTTKIDQVKLNSDMTNFLKDKGLTFSGSTGVWTPSITPSITATELFDISGTTLNGWAKGSDDKRLTADQVATALAVLGITTITIPSSVTDIAANAFYDSGTGLSTIPSTVGSTAVTVVLPTGLQTIGANAFTKFPLASLSFSGLTALTTIGNSAFSDSALTDIDLSGCSALTTINPLAFVSTTGATTLQTVEMPTGTTWKLIGGTDPLVTSDASANATNLRTKDNTWATTGLQKAA